MANKSAHKEDRKKQASTLKEKRAAKKAKKEPSTTGQLSDGLTSRRART